MINRDDNPDYLNAFLDYTLINLNKSPNSVKEYNYDLANFLRYIKQKYCTLSEKEENFKDIIYKSVSFETIKTIKLSDIRSYLSMLRTTENCKATTIARKSSSIRIFFNYLTSKDEDFKLDKNPAQDLENPKLERRLPKYLSLEESKKLLSSAQSISPNDRDNRNIERDYAIITLFLNCGMRLSELVGIDINDIDFSENKMTVIGKGNKERIIYLNKACMNAINNYLKVRPCNIERASDKNALFLSERHERIANRTVQYIVKNELKKAGIDSNKYSVHKLRHTAATLMYQYGDVDIRALQELLGHESISTTEIYTHVANEQVRNAVESNPLANL
jgi:site-specific recombinase XerD